MSQSIRNRRATPPSAHFHRNSLGGASWLFFGVALSTRISKIWVFVRALKKQPTDFRQSTSYFEDRTLGLVGLRHGRFIQWLGRMFC